MNHGKTLFNQLVDFASKYEFNKSVRKFSSRYRPKKFTHWEQFLCMSFAQLTHRESLRDIEVCFRSCGSKLYHLGIRSAISRSTLADANETRDYQIFADFAQSLMREAQECYRAEDLGNELSQAVYALDSTVIDLCLSLFPWAHVYDDKAGVRVNALLALKGNIPCFISITTRLESELVGMDELVIEPGAMYIFDRGYFDWARLYRFTSHAAHFVIRAKGDLKFHRRRSLVQNADSGIRSDQLIVPFSERAQENYPAILRRISYHDDQSDRRFIFLTNNLNLPPNIIASLYRSRWQIELFFKWIKQHLRIKAFYGTSFNAIKTQIWIALATYLLVAIAKKRLGLPHSLYTILQVLSVSPFEKIPLFQAFSNTQSENVADYAQLEPNQPVLPGFPTGH